jgi:MerR HTH family regulatory protein
MIPTKPGGTAMAVNFNGVQIEALFAAASRLPTRADLVSIREATQILGCSLRTLRYMQARNEMPPRHRRGRTLFYKRADIARMMQT